MNGAGRKQSDFSPHTVACSDLDLAIQKHTDDGYRLDMIVPADSPREASMSRAGETLRLISEPHDGDCRSPRVSEGVTSDVDRYALANAQASASSPATADGSDLKWTAGRAGMMYRDLIPDRLGGRLIASHIRIVDGGPVADGVHYHKAAFQMIYCLRGAITVVYEDQGEPFTMLPGDCVLQPPEIRHRVLDAEANSEVVELTTPAVHETWFDHEMKLPTGGLNSDRVFGTQRFRHHQSSGAEWKRFDRNGYKYRDTGIKASTDGLADVRVLKCPADGALPGNRPSTDSIFFRYVLSGTVDMKTDDRRDRRFNSGDAFVTSQTVPFTLICPTDTEILRVELKTNGRNI